MSDLRLILMTIINVLEGLVAISLNAIIVILNVKNKIRTLKLSTSDLIHVVMAVANITMRGVFIANSIGVLIPAWYVIETFYIVVVSLPFLIYFSNWLTAWLCAYYFLTITNFSHRLCVWVKRSFSKFLPHLLILSGIVSFAVNLPSIWTVYWKIQAQYTPNGTFISTTFTKITSSSLLYTIPIIYLGLCFPFLIIISSLIITVSSLLSHMRNITQADFGSSHPNLQAHMNAIRTMILFLILSVMVSIAEIMIFTEMSNTSVPLYYFCWYVVMLFPSTNAIIIIQASSKLRNMFLKRSCAV